MVFAQKKGMLNVMKKKRRSKLSWQKKACCFMLPCLFGTAVFFLLPFCRVVYYSVISDQFRKQFAGMENYMETIQNPYFQLAVKNSTLFLVIAVPILLMLALFVTFGMESCFHGQNRWVVAAFLLPMVIPTAAGAQIFRFLFAENTTILPILCMFLWKNMGICVIFLSAAIQGIDRSVLEAAAMDGAGKIKRFWYMKMPLIMPSVVFSCLLSIVNTFRIFKESYLFYGSGYPPDGSYTLQYFMNNNFLKLDYQTLSSSAVLTAIGVGILAWVLLKLQRHFS